MASSVFPTPATTALPPGAGNVIFSGISTGADYTYTTSLAAGKYILVAINSTGITSWESGSNGNQGYQGAASGTPMYIDLTATETAFNPYSTWNYRTTTFSGISLNYQQAEFANTGTLLAFPGGSNYITVTTDLVTWTTRSIAFSPATTTYQVAYNAAANPAWLATCTGTTTTSSAASSTDGVTWTLRDGAGSSGDIGRGCAINSAITNKYAMVAAGLSSYVFTSTNAVTWTRRTITAATVSPGYILTNNLSTGQVYVTTHNSTNYVTTSTDGVTWSTRLTGQTSTGASGAYGNGRYIVNAYNNGTSIGVSTDGVTWTSRTCPVAGNVFFANGKFWASATSAPGQVAVSTDGATWNVRNLLSSYNTTSTLGSGGFYYLNNKMYYQYSSIIFSPNPAYYTLYSAASATTLN